MALMRCTEYSSAERTRLLDIARASITHAAATGRPSSVDTCGLPPALAAIRSSFVTLRRAGELRGCTGSLEPRNPLAIDVAEVACRTAVADPRFDPVQPHEIDHLDIEVSVLSPLIELSVHNEDDLLTRLRPGIDGLVLTLGSRRATFLPKVWDRVPSPRRFVTELKRKAGLPIDFWSSDIVLFRYHTQTFSEAAS